jgi:hypothetical protein
MHTVPEGYGAHITHRCVHSDCDTPAAEVEVRTVKIRKYFHIITANITEL